MTPDAPRCGGCLHAKLRAVDSVTCFHPDAPWMGATLSRFDHCERHEPKVIRVPMVTEGVGYKRGEINANGEIEITRVEARPDGLSDAGRDA